MATSYQKRNFYLDNRGIEIKIPLLLAVIIAFFVPWISPLIIAFVVFIEYKLYGSRNEQDMIITFSIPLIIAGFRIHIILGLLALVAVIISFDLTKKYNIVRDYDNEEKQFGVSASILKCPQCGANVPENRIHCNNCKYQVRKRVKRFYDDFD